MSPVFDSLHDLLEYSVPTVLVVFGLAAFFLPFIKELAPKKAWSARIVGLATAGVGILLALIIEPPEPQAPVVIYALPSPTSASSTSGNAPLLDETTAHITPTGDAQPQEQGKSDIQTATETPAPVTNKIPIWAIEESGVRVDVAASGLYEVVYVGDAYSPWSNENQEGYQGWTTILYIYVNGSVEWGTTEYGLVGPVNWDSYLSPGGYYLDKADAIASAVGARRSFRLREGDYLVFVPVDEKGRYDDNRGKVDIEIAYRGR